MYPAIEKIEVKCSICKAPMLRSISFPRMACFNCKVARRQSSHILRKLRKAGVGVVENSKNKAEK